MRDKLTEIVVKIQVDACAKGPEHCENPDVWTDEIMEALILPTVKLKCQECGGDGCTKYKDCICPIITQKDKSKCELFIPCTCKEGEREWRVWWEFPNGGDYVGLMKLHATHLFYPDVAITYGALISTKVPGDSILLDNNKGRLVLREVSHE